VSRLQALSGVVAHAVDRAVGALLWFVPFRVPGALLLAAMFFRLAVEQRAREVGLLRAVGFATSGVRRLFLAEGFALAVCGSVLGAAGGVA